LPIASPLSTCRTSRGLTTYEQFDPKKNMKKPEAILTFASGLHPIEKSRATTNAGFSSDKLRRFLLAVQFWFSFQSQQNPTSLPLPFSLAWESSSFSTPGSRRSRSVVRSPVGIVSSRLHSRICMVKRRMVSQLNLLTSTESMSSVTSVLVLGKKFAHTLVSVPATGQTKYCSKKTKKIHACRLCSY